MVPDMNYKMLLKLVLVLLSFPLIGCSSTDPRPLSIFDNEKDTNRSSIVQRRSADTKAYKAGVRDALARVKSQQTGRERYVYEEPRLECGVKVPARVVGGILYPEHEECVQYAEGRYVLRQTKNDPTSGN